MITCISGGKGSGKSAFAENLMLRENKAHLPMYYLATMERADEDAVKRIAKHRSMRAGKGFETIEQPTNVDTCGIQKPCVVLLECVTNLVANELFSENGCHENVPDAVCRQLKTLDANCDRLYVVTGDMKEEDFYDGQTTHYIRTLRETNKRVFMLAETVYEMQNGVAVKRKGTCCNK